MKWQTTHGQTISEHDDSPIIVTGISRCNELADSADILAEGVQRFLSGEVE